MKEDIKRRWIEALKSGEYEQGSGALRDGDTYCCLGVLCDLHDKMHDRKKTWKNSSKHIGYNDYSYGGQTAILPQMVAKWAGLQSHDPKVSGGDNGEHMTLSAANDFGFSFAQIADMIEEYL